MDMIATYEFTRAWILTRRAPRGDRGSGLVEYAVLVALLAVVCVVAVTLLSRASQGKVSPVTTSTVP